MVDISNRIKLCKLAVFSISLVSEVLILWLPLGSCFVNEIEMLLDLPSYMCELSNDQKYLNI